MATQTNPFFQVGIIVPDLDAAMEELGTALGLSWGTIIEPQYEGHTIRVVFSIEGPPHIELIQGFEGGPWDTAAGPRLDHIGYWAPDVATTKHELAARGMPIDTDGEELGNPIFTYHRAPVSGLRVELIDDAIREQWFATMGLER